MTEALTYPWVMNGAAWSAEEKAAWLAWKKIEDSGRCPNCGYALGPCSVSRSTPATGDLSVDLLVTCWHECESCGSVESYIVDAARHGLLVCRNCLCTCCDDHNYVS